MLLSDNLLLFALNLACLLMFSMLLLFVLICRKHWQRRKRLEATVEIDKILGKMSDQGLFRETNRAFHGRLRYYYEHDYLDLLYACVRHCQALSGQELETYRNNAVRCGLFDRIPKNLRGSDAARICIALEICGLAGLRQYVADIEPYSWQPVFAPFACHALVRLDFADGMESLFRAYSHNLVNNCELLMICSEFGRSELVAWASQSSHWPLPVVLHQYWMTA